MAEGQSKRRFVNRSKTGCRICRARRIKCDETPESCHNCTSTGRKCEYDIQRLPRQLPGKRLTVGSIVRSTNIADGFRWKITSDERLCFSFFQHRSLPTIIGYFDSPLWQSLVLQLSQIDQAVYHAVVAFSAIHADYEARGNPLAIQSLDNSWQRFAIDQCGRAYALLTARSASQDPTLQQVTLEVLNHYTPTFENIVTLAEGITASFTERPSILLHMGVIAPLFFVSTECSEHEVRWRAIRALQSWPHREGTWDSSLVARIAIETIKAEEQTVKEGGQSSHVSHAYTTVSPEDQSYGEMVYTLDDGDEVQSRSFSLE
ncbi:hypothetical protein RU639_008243 [Aspergillus parasiticus]